MAKFELELSVREKRRLMSILNRVRSRYKKSLQATERGELDFESEEQKEYLVRKTTGAVYTLDQVLTQLHDQNPN